MDVGSGGRVVWTLPKKFSQDTENYAVNHSLYPQKKRVYMQTILGCICKRVEGVSANELGVRVTLPLFFAADFASGTA